MTAKEIADLFVELELHLIKSLKRNLLRHKRQEKDEGGKDGVPEHWEAWQSAKLRDVRRFRRENQDILGEYSSAINEETERLILDQYAEGGADGFFNSSDDRVRSLIHEMQNNEARVEKAALRYMNDVYRKTILRTATAMTSGGMTLQKAVDEATKDFLAQGINCVQYANGRLVNIASYAEMALRTCATRAMLMGEAKQRERLGIDTVLVSQYGACSDTCLPWQGRVYIDDVFQAYHGPRGSSFGVSRNGRQYMLLSVAIKAGLFHPNCRHTITTWIEGISTMPKPMDIREIERVNKLEAEQRRLEREVRKAKREVAGLTDPAAVETAKRKLRVKQKALRDFVKENSDVLRRDPWRERDDKTNLRTMEEQSPRPTKDGNYGVDWTAVHDPEYERRFDALPGPPEAKRAVCVRAKWALNNRDGSKTEELYAVDMRDGTEVSRITDQQFEQGVRRTPSFEKAISEATRKGAQIMLIHNHPAGSPPSVGDLNALVGTPGAEGITVGHNGSLYRYTAPKTKIPQADFEVAYRKNLVYTGVTAYEKALEELGRTYGFTFERL